MEINQGKTAHGSNSGTCSANNCWPHFPKTSSLQPKQAVSLQDAIFLTEHTPHDCSYSFTSCRNAPCLVTPGPQRGPSPRPGHHRRVQPSRGLHQPWAKSHHTSPGPALLRPADNFIFCHHLCIHRRGSCSLLSWKQVVFLLKKKRSRIRKAERGSLPSSKPTKGDKQKKVGIYKNRKLLFPIGFYLSDLKKYRKWQSGLVQTSKHLSSLGSKALSCVDSYTPGTSQSFSKY